MTGFHHFISTFPWTLIAQWFNIILTIALIVVFVKLIRLLFRSLKKYLGEDNPAAAREAAAIRMTLSQRLKTLRTEHGFTQELVASSLGVSRQAVSKWENGTSEPSTSNLFALAKLYGISVTELLQNIEI